MGLNAPLEQSMYGVWRFWTGKSCLILASVIAFACPSMVRAQDPTGVIKKNTREEVFELGQLGIIHALVPTTKIKSVAIFVSGDGSWNDGITDMAQLLANEGALVAGVDVVPYLKSLNNGNAECANVADDFSAILLEIRARYPSADTSRPIVVGYSSGATLAYAIVAQAQSKTFGGALSLGFCTTLEIQRPLCKGRSVAFHRTTEGLELLPTRLDVPWYVLQGSVDQACTVKEVASFAAATASARLVALPKVGHGFAVARRWQPQYVAAFKELVAGQQPVQAAKEKR
jgi:type IV secretory pathway VirJ component